MPADGAPLLDSPVLLAVCGASVPALTLCVSLEQALLAAAFPAGCVWALQSHADAHVSWSAGTIYTLSVVAAASTVWKGFGEPGLLPTLALASLALTATRLPRMVPGSEFMPWGALLALEVSLFFGGPEARIAAGFAVGRMDGWPLAWAVLCVVLSTVALCGWSLLWVGGDHGPIQDALGPRLSPAFILLFAGVNALGEEVEFRMLQFGGLLAQPACQPLLWLALTVMLQAGLFAVLHVAAGFPSGASGGLLVFIWAVFLGILRLWTGGMALVLLLHVQADIVVFTLVYVQELRLQRKVLPEESERAGGPGPAADQLWASSGRHKLRVRAVGAPREGRVDSACASGSRGWLS